MRRTIRVRTELESILDERAMALARPEGGPGPGAGGAVPAAVVRHRRCRKRIAPGRVRSTVGSRMRRVAPVLSALLLIFAWMFFPWEGGAAYE